MKLGDFDYELPESQVAQEALADRGASRLMVVPSDAAPPVHATFRDLPDYLSDGDLLVVNESRVLPARLMMRRQSGGRVEALYLRHDGDDGLVAWVRPLGRLRPGEALTCEDGETVVRFDRVVGEREARVRVPGGDVIGLLERLGHVPLPPYIRRDDRADDRDRYQTVFARADGSVAAPTAGLHFDRHLLAELDSREIRCAPVVLHVGPGTFAPLEHDTVTDNELHSEVFSLCADTISRITRARSQGRRIIAVGTTVTRALESAHAMGWLEDPARDRCGATNLFIYPGYEFQVVDCLVTNFHLPQSSLLMLVCAFAGRERVLSCYREAVDSGYRFFSYGDAMLLSRYTA